MQQKSEVPFWKSNTGIVIRWISVIPVTILGIVILNIFVFSFLRSLASDIWWLSFLSNSNENIWSAVKAFCTPFAVIALGSTIAPSKVKYVTIGLTLLTGVWYLIVYVLAAIGDISAYSITNLSQINYGFNPILTLLGITFGYTVSKIRWNNL